MKNAQKGTTLIEVIIAITLFTVSMTAGFSTYIVMRGTAVNTQKRLDGAIAAKTMIDYFRLLDYHAITSSQCITDDITTRSTVAFRTLDSTVFGTYGESKVLDITLTVTWPGKSATPYQFRTSISTGMDPNSF